MVGGGPGGTLMRCAVDAEVNGQQNVGGLVGQVHDGTIIECCAIGTVVGNNKIGGLMGTSGRTMILNSLANCEVAAEQIAGGLIGSTTWPGLVLANCHAQGSITGSVIGGLAGQARHNQIMNCYAVSKLIGREIESEEPKEPVVGGLFGDTIIPAWAPATVACFWDTEYSEITVSTGSDLLEIGTGLTTEQMRDEEIFRNAGWDFNHTWMICEGEYPKLQWEGEDCNDL
jgi:hypothetical protein